MKNIWLIAFVFFNGFLGYAQKKSLFQRYTSLELYSSYEISETPSLDKLCLGGKLSLPFMSSSFYYKDVQFTYGVSLYTKKLFPQLPVTIKMGKLSFGGAYTKINSPELSSSLNSYTTSINKPYGITASNPSSNGFSKTNSYFMQIDFFNRNPVHKLSLSSLYSEDEYGLSFLYSYGSSRFKVFSLESAILTYHLEDNLKSYWYFSKDKDRYFHQDYFLKGNLQIFSTINNYSTLLTISAYENPFGQIVSTIKSENHIKTNQNNLSFSGFYAPYGVYTGINSYVEPQIQLKTSWNYSFSRINLMEEKANPLHIKTGFSLYIHSQFQNEYTLKGNISTRFSKNQFSGTISGNLLSSINNGKMELNTLSFQTKENINKLSFSETISLKKENTNLWTTSENLSFSGRLFDNPNFSFSGSFSSSQKQQEIIKQNLSLSSNLKWKWKLILITLKITGEINLMS